MNKEIEVLMYWIPKHMIENPEGLGLNDHDYDVAEGLGNVCTLPKFAEIVNSGDLNLNNYYIFDGEIPKNI